VRHTLVAAVLLGVAQVSPPAGGQNPQTPVFRSGISVVPLTVTVVDRDGVPVADLARADFTVYENGQPREILNFYPQTFTAQPDAIVAPGAAGLRWSPAGLAPATRRAFLFVLGFGRIQYPAKGVDGALAFVREKLLPQDLVAVLAFNRASEFTTDHAEVARLLERFRQDHERLVLEIREFRRRNLRSTELPEFIQQDIDALFSGRPVPRRRGAPRFDSEPSLVPFRSATDLLLNMDAMLPIVENAWDRQQTYAELTDEIYRRRNSSLSIVMLQSTLAKLYSGIEYLRPLAAEKHLVFLGERPSFRLGAGAVDDDYRLARRASDARVVMHVIYTDGTPPPPKPGRAIDPHAFNVSSAQNVSELTGGYYTSLKMAVDALGVIDRTSRVSYLIGYEPTNHVADGRFRSVHVTVNRPDLTVRYRHGYYAVEDVPPAQLKELVARARVEMAAGIAQEATGITVTADASVLPRMGVTSQLRVTVVIDASHLAFATSADGARTGELDLQVYVGDASERTIGEFSERIELSGDAATHAAWLANGIRRTVRVPFVETARYVKVVVYDYRSDLIGSTMRTLK
jgi:VWFA-related protein